MDLHGFLKNLLKKTKYQMKLLLKLLILININVIYSQQEFEILNTSINSKYAELGALFLNNNKVLFATSKKLETDKPFSKNRRKHNRELYLEIFQGQVDEKGDIKVLSSFSKDVYNKFFEFDICFTPDYKNIYFTWNNFYMVQEKNASPVKQALYLFKANIDSNFNLSNIQPVRFNSKDYSNRSPRVTPNGKHLIYSSNMKNGFGKYDLYIVDILSNGSHSTPRNLGPNINSFETEMYPFIDENNTLYFSSYGHQENGRLNIYKSEFIDGAYQVPEKLPAPINSGSDDFGFVINPTDNTGFFTSNRKGGKGDVDVYAFKPKEIECNQHISGIIRNAANGKLLDNVSVNIYQNNEVLDTLNLGNGVKYKYKLNCNESYLFVFKKDGFEDLKVELSTTDKDLIKINKDVKLAPIICDQIVLGNVYNKSTNQPLENVKVKIYNNDKLIDSQIIQSDTEFSFSLKCNETYKIVAEKQFFSSSEIEFNTNDVHETEIIQSLQLAPIICTQLISGVVLDKETKLPLSNSTVKIYKNNKLIDSIKTDSNANYNYKLDCSHSYRLVASQLNYSNDITAIQTSRSMNKELTNTFYLESNVEFVTVREQKMIKTKPIYFDLNEARIRKDASIELDKVINILIKYPTIKLEIKSHTDSRAPDNYNMNLSDKRAKSTIRYIINSGIDPNRITGRGYGESELINKCTNGIKCSEDEHQLNRRTEFIVIDE